MKEMSKKMKIIALIIALVILVGIIVTFTVGLNFDLRYQEITEEQKTDIINKINGKYELELTADSTQITNVPHTRGRDIVRPYLAPFAIATGIILAYMAIRYYKLGMVLTLGIEIAIRNLGRQANINKGHPHKFRRTIATMAIDKDMPVEQVQKLLGHIKIDTTMEYAMVNQNNVKNSHRKYIT